MEKEKSYLDGFNAGHKLRQYNPELFEKLKASLSMESEFEKGVIEGAQEFEKSIEKGREDDLVNIRDKQNGDRSKHRGQER